MATTTANKPAQKTVARKGTAAPTRREAEAAEVHEVKAIETLVEGYKLADKHEHEHASAFEAAALGIQVAHVWKARTAYLIATHPSILRGKQTQNLMGAAKALGMRPAQRNTLAPYVAAGERLFKAGRLYIEDAPGAEDIAIVDKALDDTMRAAKREARLAAKAQVPAVESGESAERPAQSAPVAEPSLQVDIMATAQRLLQSAQFAAKSHVELDVEDRELLAQVLAEVSSLLEL